MTPALALGLGWLLVAGAGAVSRPPATARPKASPIGKSVPVAKPAASFTGRWRLNLAASDPGSHIPRERTEDIVEDGVWLAVHEVIIRDDGDTTRIDYRYRTDGETVNSVAGQEVRTKGSRQGGVLLFESRARILVFDVRQVERWSLSDSASTLTIDRDSHTPLGQEQQRLVFRREK